MPLHIRLAGTDDAGGEDMLIDLVTVDMDHGLQLAAGVAEGIALAVVDNGQTTHLEALQQALHDTAGKSCATPAAARTG